MAQVYLPTPLRRLAHGQTKVAAEGRTVEEALLSVERQYPGLREQLREASGEVRSFINVFVNGTEIRSLQGPATPLGEDDEISIIPAMAGGGCRAEMPGRRHPVAPSSGGATLRRTLQVG
ncbi:MAG TPA: ubiquitin-like small modifier protein 1 [bacterium]|nr:ubiquitin-like small modifier protein 1 [bacterium]